MLQYIRDQILELAKESLLVSSVITYRSLFQPDPQTKLNRIEKKNSLVCLIGSGIYLSALKLNS